MPGLGVGSTEQDFQRLNLDTPTGVPLHPDPRCHCPRTAESQNPHKWPLGHWPSALRVEGRVGRFWHGERGSDSEAENLEVDTG